MANYKSSAIYITLMSELAGFWETELERVVQKLSKGGAVRVLDHDGREVVVKVEPIDPGREEINDHAWA
jgi:hypothetical protein